MNRPGLMRYDDVAVLLHWLIALFIIGLLAVGKYMVSLDENDPARYALTQWHKSFGFTVLFLSVIRLVWRMSHRPPRDPDSIPQWQKNIAHLVHWALYGLLFFLPISGWILVSASPLNLDTVLFDAVTIPHLPPFDRLDNREQIAGWFYNIHEMSGNILILLLLAHAGAALKHHFVDKDTVLLRMLPNLKSRSLQAKSAALGLAMAGAATGLYLYADSGDQAALLAAGASEVSFTAQVGGDAAVGYFTESEVTAMLDPANTADSSIVATVQTASISSDNSQLEGTLPDAEWFSTDTHPTATFESTSIALNEDGSLQVVGTLEIKGNSNEVSFPMTLSDEEGKQVARGEFVVDRSSFDIGMESQASEDMVAHDVTVNFRFDIAVPDG